MATELRFRLQTMAAQALTGQTNQAAVGSTQQVADLEGTLMIRVLKLKMFLELSHRCEHSLAIPGLADALRPHGIFRAIGVVVNLGSSPTDPGLGVGKVQLLVALARLIQRPPRENHQTCRRGEGLGLKPIAQMRQGAFLRQLQAAVEIQRQQPGDGAGPPHHRHSTHR